MEKQIFYHHLRLIFTYYACQGHKQQPLIMREKNLQKFMNESTLCQLLQNKQQKNNSSPTKYSSIKNQNSKSLQVIINSFNKPLYFEEFVKLLHKLIYGSKLNQIIDNQIQQEQKNQDLYDLCKEDQILLNIFSFLYEQIEHSTQIGRIIIFSQQKEHFNQQAYKTIMKNLKLIKTIYFHYFPKADKHEKKDLKKILGVLKIPFHQFEIIPQKLSLTQVFILFLEVMNSKSKSVYEQQFQRILQKDSQIEDKEWSQFTFLQFIKIFIMVSNILSLKNSDTKQFEFSAQNIVNFLEFISISKGFRIIKSTYKLNESFFKISRESCLKNQFLLKERSKQSCIKFQVKKLEQNKSTILLAKIKKLLQIIFNAYTNNCKNEFVIMSQRKLEFFCHQFKLIPNLISKKQMDEIYMRVFQEREFYQQSRRSGQKQFIKGKQKIKDKQKLLEMIQNPTYGLQFEQFQKVLIYAVQIESICKEFTANQRLIYWLQHMFSQSKFKVLLEKQINQNRSTTDQIDYLNPKILIKKYIDEQQVLDMFQKDHKSMYIKLKRHNQ